MTKLIKIEEDDLTNFLAGENKSRYCEELESANILFFEKCPFKFPKKDLEFLLSQKQSGAANRKNIAYKPAANKITNAVEMSEKDSKRLLEVMQHYSQCVVKFLGDLLPPYASHWSLDYASFRPFQEKGRQLRTRARNDLLHVDSFPTRPMHGRRILRFFTNINPKESRLWTTSDPFEVLAKRFAGKQVDFPPSPNPVSRAFKSLGRSLGFPILLRSPYDTFMLNMHNFLKENEEFQKNCHKDYWEFPPHSCWIVFTDQVSHAATAGQYALEQTILVPHTGLVNPQTAPVSVLEKLANRTMIDAKL